MLEVGWTGFTGAVDGDTCTAVATTSTCSTAVCARADDTEVNITIALRAHDVASTARRPRVRV